MEEAQAASMVILGPLKLKTLAMRPAVTLDSSPGMVSSVIFIIPSSMPASYSFNMASRLACGSAAKEAVFLRISSL